MSSKFYDIVIIGSGIAGLYSAYNIKKVSPQTSFVVLEKYKKNWLGGRTSNDTFYGTTIVTGAGIGRKKKDKLLVKLLNDLNIPTHEYSTKTYFSQTIEPLSVNDMKDILMYLKKRLVQHINERKPNVTFKEFAINNLGLNIYNQFILSTGYSDYENEDAEETLYHYGMEDNYNTWTALEIPWKRLILTMYHFIGSENIKTSNNVISIKKVNDKPCKFIIETDKDVKYLCNKVILATTIDGIRKLVPGSREKNSIYNQIEGQTFLRVYAKFSKKSIPIMKEYIKGYTIVPGPLQKIIPINANQGVYMISYSDNAKAISLKKHLENTSENCAFFADLLENALGISKDTLHIISIKSYYWPIGTHYYKPLNSHQYANRDSFIYAAQHPEKCMLVVGEVVSRNQGWTEGALESVKTVLTKKWILDKC